MKGKSRVPREYSIFGSAARGIAEAEERVVAILAEKETPENLALFAKAISEDWKRTQNNAAALRLAFSDFAKLLEQNKSEISHFLSSEREKRKSQLRSSQLLDSRTF
jgi:hypothetical protein